MQSQKIACLSDFADDSFFVKPDISKSVAAIKAQSKIAFLSDFADDSGFVKTDIFANDAAIKAQ